MTPSVIINADDFGLSPGISRGIVSAFREGVLSSTTMLVNLDGFEDAVRLAGENPDLPVGIHLSLLWGPPVSDPSEVRSLVDGGGRFPRSLTTLGARYALGRLSMGEVRRELGRQVRIFLDAGLVPTHVDTHKHVHGLPGVLDAVIDVAREHGIERLRLPREERLDFSVPGARPSPASEAKRLLLRFFFRGARERIRRAGMRTTDHFVGIAHQGCLNSDVLHRILSSLGRGVTELMCHPGNLDEPAREYSSTPPNREVELASLKDPRVKHLVASGAVRLTHYGEL